MLVPYGGDVGSGNLRDTLSQLEAKKDLGDYKDEVAKQIGRIVADEVKAYLKRHFLHKEEFRLGPVESSTIMKRRAKRIET